MLKENDIKEFLQCQNINYCEQSSLWGTVFPKKITYLAGSAAALLSMQYYVLHFNQEGIAIIGINNTTGKIVENAFAFISNNEISHIAFQKKMMSYELKITTNKGSLAYKINKTMIGTPWHKENLPKILQKFS